MIISHIKHCTSYDNLEAILKKGKIISGKQAGHDQEWGDNNYVFAQIVFKRRKSMDYSSVCFLFDKCILKNYYVNKTWHGFVTENSIYNPTPKQLQTISPSRNEVLLKEIDMKKCIGVVLETTKIRMDIMHLPRKEYIKLGGDAKDYTKGRRLLKNIMKYTTNIKFIKFRELP
jgi:hypothetical protein